MMLWMAPEVVPCPPMSGVCVWGGSLPSGWGLFSPHPWRGGGRGGNRLKVL